MKFGKKISIEEYDNELRNLEQEELETKMHLFQIAEKKSKLLGERRNIGIKEYISSEKRKQLLDEAEGLGFSLKEITYLREFIDKWDQDNVENDTIDRFRNVEKYVRKLSPHKDTFFYKIGRLYGGENDEY